MNKISVDIVPSATLSTAVTASTAPVSKSSSASMINRNEVVVKTSGSRPINQSKSVILGVGKTSSKPSTSSTSAIETTTTTTTKTRSYQKLAVAAAVVAKNLDSSANTSSKIAATKSLDAINRSSRDEKFVNKESISLAKLDTNNGGGGDGANDKRRSNESVVYDTTSRF